MSTPRHAGGGTGLLQCTLYTVLGFKVPNHCSSFLCRGLIGMGLVAKGAKAVQWHGEGDPGKFPIAGAAPQGPSASVEQLVLSS